MKLITAKVQVPYVPVQFNPRTEASALAALDSEPSRQHSVLDSSEECWHFLANNDCEPIDDAEIEKMVMLIGENMEILLEAESFVTDNDQQAELNNAIEELEWQQDTLRKEVNRRAAMDIVARRKRTSSLGVPPHGGRTGSSGSINRGFSKAVIVSNGSAEGAVKGLDQLPRETVLETQPNPIQQTASKTNLIVPRKHVPKRPLKKLKRRRIIIEY